MAMFDTSVLKPLPVKAFDVRCASAAYRFVSQARHTGKVVLTIPDGPGNAVLAGSGGGLAGGSVLITGGTGMAGSGGGRPSGSSLWGGPCGVGQPQRLRRRRGRRIWSSGSKTPGPRCRWWPATSADRDAVAGPACRSCRAQYPLKGVFHAAGVLDDGLIASLTHSRVDTVLRAKVDGAWRVFRLTRDVDLSAFVMFSSMTARIVGPQAGRTPRPQTASLTSWPPHRRAQGLVGLSVAWGLWEQASGMTQHLDERDKARMSRIGLAPMATEQALRPVRYRDAG